MQCLCAFVSTELPMNTRICTKAYDSVCAVKYSTELVWVLHWDQMLEITGFISILYLSSQNAAQYIFI